MLQASELFSGDFVDFAASIYAMDMQPNDQHQHSQHHPNLSTKFRYGALWGLDIEHLEFKFVTVPLPHEIKAMRGAQKLAAAMAQSSTFVEVSYLLLQVFDPAVGMALPLTSSLSAALKFAGFFTTITRTKLRCCT